MPKLMNTLIQGAFYGILAGFGIGIVRFGLEFGYVVPPCGSGLPDPRPVWVKYAVGNLNFLHFSPVSFVFTSVVVFLVSLVTKPMNEKHVIK